MRRAALILMLATLLLGAFAMPGAARPGETHVAADAFTIQIVDPGESWIQGNVWHVRDAEFLALVVGTGDTAEYLTGDQVSSANWNWNLKNGVAQVWGTAKLMLDGFDGGWFTAFAFGWSANPDAIAGPGFDPADPLTWPCVPWTKTGAIGKGFGDLEGGQIRLDVDSATCSAVMTFDGMVFWPGA